MSAWPGRADCASSGKRDLVGARLLFAGLRAASNDAVTVLEVHAEGPLSRLLPGLIVGFLLAVLLYVPVHELLHGLGCLALGGTVTSIEISPLFGGQLLAKIIPAVSTTTKYAGRLAGFDVGGSDLRLLGTDLAPYLLTILIGIPLLRHLKQRPNAWLLGPAFLLAMAPWMSITGDYYEIGSVLVTRLLSFSGYDWLALRSDDMVTLCKLLWLEPATFEVGDVGGGLAATAVVALSFSLGLFLASCTYGMGMAVAGLIAPDGRRTR